MSERSSSGYTFTSSQWEELEHQALIYKYMVSGIPVPSDLILPIRRSLIFDSTQTSPTMAFPPQTQLGWSCIQMGFGRKAEDPEPGRCRRTDGKKWRCSKEAYPDSKYCERHMHRGKNRSRKPVEIPLATTTHASSSSSPPFSSSSSSPTLNTHPSKHSISTPNTYQHSYPYSNTNRPSGSHSTTTSNLQSDSVSHSDRHCRYDQAMKHLEGYNIFSDASGADRESPLQLKPLGMSSLTEANQRSYSLSKEEEEERERPLRHFFDECPQKNKQSWMELEEENTSYNKPQLSISFPK